MKASRRLFIRLTAGAATLPMLLASRIVPWDLNFARAQAGPLLVNTAEIDIVPGSADAFLAALKENAQAAIKEPGCREFNISIAQNDPNHVLTFTVFESVAALESHRKTDAYKKFREATKGMIAKNANRQFSAVAINHKAKM